jgi:hypothetical protein
MVDNKGEKTMAKRRYYVAGDGTKYLLREAMVPFSFKVYRSDCKSAVVGDPFNCLISVGARRHKNVVAMYIGTGKDAYVVMTDGRGGKPIAYHYTINAKASKVRDNFDTKKKLDTQVITLSVPTPGRTLDHRKKLGKARYKAIKAGAEVKKRGPSISRVQRIGVKYRPHATIEDNVVSIKPRENEVAA